MAKLKDKVAFITGAGIGIGRAGALLFAREGAKVAVADVSREHGEETVRLIREDGGASIFLQTDVSNETQVADALAATVAAYGGIDVLYNNAGGSSERDGTVTDISIEEFWRVLNVDLFGTFLCCRLAIPLMIEAGGGVIINTTSTVALRGVRKTDGYTSAKGAVLSLTQSMAVNYAHRNIRINALAPAGIHTERLLRRLEQVRGTHKGGKSGHLLGDGTPEDVATAALFLASNDSRYITGVVLPVDGGWTTVGPSV